MQSYVNLLNLFLINSALSQHYAYLIGLGDTNLRSGARS